MGLIHVRVQVYTFTLSGCAQRGWNIFGRDLHRKVKKCGGGMSIHPYYNGFIPPYKLYYSMIPAAETMLVPDGPP